MKSSRFRIADSRRAFERFLSDRGNELHGLSLQSALDVMTDFSELCLPRAVGRDGDALLAQAGTISSSTSVAAFEVDFVRQFISRGRDPEFWQLHLTFSCDAPTTEIEPLELWSFDLPLPEWKSAVMVSPAFQFASQRQSNFRELLLEAV